MGKETSTRIQTSILNALEKKALVWLAGKQPRWMTSDVLTYIGVLGAVVCAVGFALANLERPVYGFFIDHTLDAITISIMCIGAGLSPIFRLDVALLVLAGYLVLSIYTYVCTILKGEFRLTYGSLGPTEFRLIVIIINTVVMYTPWVGIRMSCECLGTNVEYGVFDIAGVAIAVILFVMQFSQFLKDRRILSAQDPLKSYNPQDK